MKNDKIISKSFSIIITGVLVEEFLRNTVSKFFMDPERMEGNPESWYMIKGTRKKLGKDYNKYIGVKFIYPKNIICPQDGYVIPRSLNQSIIEPCINRIYKRCKFEKKIKYIDRNKRLIYELFIKKDQADAMFALFKIQKSL